ncbi:MAG: CBS domain-containing protein [Sulfuritalea sp.]|jgi:acetoin utilization protein AcuB|nr:CBS domain-containing protein [Sulfuritalea sp.]
MIVRNWMRADPVVIGSDTLLSEAKRVLTENNLHGLPVVDDGRLRGLITRANCLRAAHFALRTQDTDELNYFSNRLKVRDLMVRNPATIDANDTMEHCLRLGQELGVAQFPVMDQGQVVGMISANEIFSLAAHFLGAWEKRSGVTLAPLELKPGLIGKITDITEGAGAEVQAIYPIGKPEDINPQDHHRKKVIIRFHCADTRNVVKALENAGFPVIESVQAVH